MRLELIKLVSCTNSFAINSISWTADGKHLITVSEKDVIIRKWPEMTAIITTGFNFDKYYGNFKTITTKKWNVFLLLHNGELKQITEFGEKVLRFNEIIGVDKNNDAVLFSKNLTFDRLGRYVTWFNSKSLIVGEFHNSSRRIIIKDKITNELSHWSIADLVFSPDNKIVVSFENTNRLDLEENCTWQWDFKSHVAMQSVTDSSCRMVFSPNSRYLACLCPNEVRVFKWKSQELYKTITLPKHTRIKGCMKDYNIIFDRMGKFLICNTYFAKDIHWGDNYLFLIDWKKETILQELELSNINCLGLSPCGEFLIVGSQNAELGVFKLI